MVIDPVVARAPSDFLDSVKYRDTEAAAIVAMPRESARIEYVKVVDCAWFSVDADTGYMPRSEARVFDSAMAATPKAAVPAASTPVDTQLATRGALRDPVGFLWSSVAAGCGEGGGG